MEKDKRNQWHPAFYGAMHLELKDNKDDLEFTEELILNTLPLRVDLLIIKKYCPCMIKNEIGELFETHNLLEYKSPDDSLNYNSFLKGIAYAYLYKSSETHIDDILLEDITLSFIRQRKPIKLFKKLKQEHFRIVEKCPGIYYINKDGFIKIQIIVSKELRFENHIWLNSLTENMDTCQISKLIDATQKLVHLDDKNYADSVWEIVATLNKQNIQLLQEDEDMCKALAEIMKPEIDKAFHNGFNNGTIEKSIHIFKNMIKDGMPKELAQKYAELSDQMVEQILAKL